MSRNPNWWKYAKKKGKDGESTDSPTSKAHRDKYHGEIIAMLHANNVSAWSNPTSQYQEDPGRSDITAAYGGRSMFVEVKTGYKNSFDFAEWRDNQRQWAREQCRERSQNDYWLAIVIETEHCPYPTLRANSNPNSKQPRVAYLIPESIALLTEREFMRVADQRTIPYKAAKGYSVIIQKNCLDCSTLWADFALEWRSGWVLPVLHPFRSAYLSAPLSLWEVTNDTRISGLAARFSISA